jgi:hypothetical protein
VSSDVQAFVVKEEEEEEESLDVGGCDDGYFQH